MNVEKRGPAAVAWLKGTKVSETSGTIPMD